MRSTNDGQHEDGEEEEEKANGCNELRGKEKKIIQKKDQKKKEKKEND